MNNNFLLKVLLVLFVPFNIYGLDFAISDMEGAAPGRSGADHHRALLEEGINDLSSFVEKNEIVRRMTFGEASPFYEGANPNFINAYVAVYALTESLLPDVLQLMTQNRDALREQEDQVVPSVEQEIVLNLEQQSSHEQDLRAVLESVFGGEGKRLGGFLAKAKIDVSNAAPRVKNEIKRFIKKI